MKHPLIYILILVTMSVIALALFEHVMYLRMQRDVSALILQNKMDIYQEASRQLVSTTEKLGQIQKTPEPWNNSPYLVISIAEHMLWYKQEGKLLFKAPVATGSGKTLVRQGSRNGWRFETPRGRMVVQRKEEDPVWVPPDWHYVEQSRMHGRRLYYLGHEQPLNLSDGSIVSAIGYDVVRQYPDGRQQSLTASSKKEIVLDGKLVVPPVGTAQRRYKNVLGPFSLELGDGYAIHGTDQPTSIGRDISHGCIRMYNKDITTLFKMVQIGTPVYIY